MQQSSQKLLIAVDKDQHSDLLLAKMGGVRVWRMLTSYIYIYIFLPRFMDHCEIGPRKTVRAIGGT